MKVTEITPNQQSRMNGLKKKPEAASKDSLPPHHRFRGLCGLCRFLSKLTILPTTSLRCPQCASLTVLGAWQGSSVY
jgi:hypothetical protein